MLLDKNSELKYLYDVQCIVPLIHILRKFFELLVACLNSDSININKKMLAKNKILRTNNTILLIYSKKK